ncbi:hypothetical protein M6G63_25555 (plasmid) [Pseudomonas sp. BYT-5]|uniref:helix-turn-helix domain-containing protein n=1 Tax=Pseudomonas sp. BYT-5 TaxID=2944392 RepID=UPI00201FF0EC|nr:helix-turn-helix domain-containing protein [Pseudomonas sp. BYT-5]URD45390.1 hypothetical protein M6G63_25555 [Pseudomonas sp. BYT-5]
MKDKVVSGESSQGSIPEYLVSSWQRSKKYGIHPKDEKLQTLGFRQFTLSDSDQNLARVVGREIDAIWDSFGGRNWVVYATNNQGIIIRARHGSDPDPRLFSLNVGRRVSESDLGTTAPSCAAHEKIPITLIGAEHYLNEFANLFCCAVPLWGPTGNIIGVLNITGGEEFRSALVQKKLQAAAIKLENRIFLDSYRENLIYKIHYDTDFLDTHMAGLIAVDNEANIISITRTALEMLDGINPLKKRHNLKEILSIEEIDNSGYAWSTRFSNGIVFFMKKVPADSIDLALRDSAFRKSGAMKDLTDIHVMETVKNCDGNVSKAARVLKISRTTVYRLMKRASETD